MQLLFIQSSTSRQSLVDWADIHLVDKVVPIWARNLLLPSKDEYHMFLERLVLRNLFVLPELRGVDTNPSALVELPRISESIQYVYLVPELTERLRVYVQLVTGKSVPLQEASRVGRRVVHPWVVQYQRYLLGLGRNPRGAKEKSRLAQEFLNWLPTLRKFKGCQSHELGLFHLTLADVDTYLRYLRRRVQCGEMKQTFASSKSAAVLAFLRFCMKTYGLSDVVGRLHKLSPGDTIDWWIPSTERIEEFFRSICLYSPEPLHDFVLFAVMQLLGLRPSEATNLRWGDVDLDGGYIEFLAKGGHKVRMALVSVVWQGLKALRMSAQSGDELVFFYAYAKDKRMPEMRIRYRVMATITGWSEEAWPKTFRHAFCTHLLGQRHDYLLVNRLARHTKPETTQRYLHFTKQFYSGAAAQIHDKFNFDVKGG